MNIIYLSGSRLPSREANSIHVMKMCQAFAQNGHQVTLYGRKNSRAPDNDYSYYGVAECFNIVKLNHHDFRVIGNFAYALRLHRHLRKTQMLPDLFYGRDIYSLFALSAWKRPLIYEVHEPPLHAMQKMFGAYLFRRPNFVRLVAISQALRQEYHRLYPSLPTACSIVAHDGADMPTALKNPPALRSNTSNMLQVGYAGHLYPGKGVELILAVAAQLPGVNFHLVGGTQHDIERWRQQCHLENVCFHGFVPPSHVRQYHQLFDIVLAPYQHTVQSAGKWGGDLANWMSPLKIFEYMAAQKAIIASDLPVLREVLSHQKNALLVAPDDIAGWCAAVERLGTDTALREKLSQTAYQDFVSNYTWQKRAEMVLPPG